LIVLFIGATGENPDLHKQDVANRISTLEAFFLNP
jgi:hypothetical protein